MSTGTDIGMGATGGPRPIEQVRPGMRVLDVDGADIGSVKDVVPGDPEAATVPEPPAEAGGVPVASPVGVVVGGGGVGNPAGGLFAAGLGDDLPEVERARLLRAGYVLVDLKGLFAGRRYAAADDIADVANDQVQLGVDVDHLVH